MRYVSYTSDRNVSFAKGFDGSYIKKEYQKKLHHADPFSSPLNDLVEHINPLIEDGRALSLNETLLAHQGYLRRCIPVLSVLAYTTQKPEENFKKHYTDKTIIQNQNNNGEGGIPHSSSISIFDAVSSARAYKEVQAIFNNKPIAGEIKEQFIYH